MVKQTISALALVIFLSSCTALKSLNFGNSKQVASVSAPEPQAKFINDISVTPQSSANNKVDNNTEEKTKPAEIKEVTTSRGPSIADPIIEKKEQKQTVNYFTERTAEVESASSVQLKYAVLMNTEVEYLPNKVLLQNVDEWYGVRYMTGGNTKNGVDCSGFTVAVYAAVYGINLPRVSKEQYRISRKISTTDLQAGDLVFFHTRGVGVSHVGVYLGNNKFIHASVSRGVMVSDLFEPYYVQRFIGGGRIDDKQVVASN